MKKLTQIGVYEDSISCEYDISHQNNETTLTERLILEKTVSGWLAQLDFSDIPRTETATEAVLKLSEWFERMAVELKKHEYDTFDINTVDFK